MRWRIVEVPRGEERPDDLTSGELLGISIATAHAARAPGGVYERAWNKIQPQVNIAIEDDE